MKVRKGPGTVKERAFPCTGTIVSADEIEFKRDVAGLAVEEIVATRVK